MALVTRAVITIPVTYLVYLSHTIPIPHFYLPIVNYIYLHQMPNSIFASPQLNFANAYKVYPSEIFKQKCVTFL